MIGAIAEAILVWLVDRLPVWAQWLVYGIPALAIVTGFALALQDRRRRRDG